MSKECQNEPKGQGGLVAEFVLRRAPLTNDDDGPKNCVHEYADIAVCVHCGVDVDGYSAPENLKAQIRKLERDKACNRAAYMEALQRDDERIDSLKQQLKILAEELINSLPEATRSDLMSRSSDDIKKDTYLLARSVMEEL